MNDFPLAPFLISLASDGIPIAPDDYERLALVLRTRGRWNRQQLCGVLTALLTHTPDQATLFKQQFNAFFAEDLPLAESVPEEHVRGVIEELLRLKSGELVSAPPEPPPGGDSTAPAPAGNAAEPPPPRINRGGIRPKKYPSLV